MARPQQRRTAEFKTWCVQQMAQQEQSVASLSQATGVSRRLLYYWRDSYVRDGIEGLKRPRGRPRLGTSPKRLSPDEEMALLRRKVGEQEMLIDFFRAACKQVEASRQASTASGATASTEPSAT